MSSINSDGEIENEFQHDGTLRFPTTIEDYHKEYHKAHKEHRAALIRKRVYGLSELDYSNLLLSQNGRCAICHRTPEEAKQNRALLVDHNHITGKVRGLLCSRCNLAAGYYEYEYAKQVQKYLEEN